MGQINLYKTDAAKKTEFIDKLGGKFEFLGEQDYQLADDKNITYTVGTYVSIPKNVIR